MRKNIITGVSLVALSSGMAQAGGFELQTLDTSMMYADGNTVSISYASIDASIEGVNTSSGASASSKKQVVKDQTITNLSGKFDVGESLVGHNRDDRPEEDKDHGHWVDSYRVACKETTWSISSPTSSLRGRYR